MIPIIHMKRLCGYIKKLDFEDVYVSRRTHDHFFIKYHGFGVSKTVLGELNVRGVKKIFIDYKGLLKNQLLMCTVQEMFKHGTYYNDEGDDQLVLDMERWTIIKEVKKDG